MKLSIALLFSTLALALAQDDVAAHIQTMKEKMMEQRKDMFVGRQHSTFEMIKDHHNRRMVKIEEMIEERRQMVADHESGRRLLSDEEFEKAARQVRNFSKKLEQMKNRNEDEHHMERLEDLKSLHSAERMVDFKEKLGQRN